MDFLQVDGAGNPNNVADYRQAVEALYSVSYAIKFAAKAELQRDYVVAPLEGLWWADNPDAFSARRKDEWLWTMMIMVPEFIPHEYYEAARTKAEKKIGTLPSSLRLAPFEEGLCLQTMHIGSYDGEAPTLQHLHEELMPRSGLTFNGHHHEIYISDPRRVAPENLRTVLRQPVRSL